ncbi:flagellar export chaperone FliS [Acerihabitans arboris]|uniref:Flagellar secretion chaperone FliS n=1 Tax=Acerihabitans arboris TaxID=2691583 RepID=A0A845SMX3_9GAMM|nr:flagellar export chaperone FliS [Acerihabitans arboris]NDL62595.1 flagellar export chaperone FliS [Acerihabitans arboris]
MYGSQAYAMVGLQSSVMSASPHKLITLLFDGALSALAKADICLEQGNIPGKGNAISKAIEIIGNGLKMGLDMEKGGELSQNLSDLYDYFCRQLIQVNLHNDRDLLTNIRQLLAEIADAWRHISPDNAQP